MKLENIGFYTLSDARVEQLSVSSPLWRCELILTDRCNFKCTYCRGLRSDISGTMPFGLAQGVVRYWVANGLKNVRFSGGEPTLYEGLDELVNICKIGNVEHIAISTNGSADIDYYKHLIELGVNDFSISLDACCASDVDKMAGVRAKFDRISENIKELSKLTYVTVGIVINEDNLLTCVNTIMFAHELGVSDIRVIPSAQYNKLLNVVEQIPDYVLEAHPILKYRVDNVKSNRHVRGITENDSKNCWLALDDMAVAGGYHFPCIIYMREQGNPIGKVGVDMRKERLNWVLNHDCSKDPICKKNCLDVCVDYCNKANKHFNGV